MPDLSHDGCADYWNSYPDPSIYRVITFMESVEKWTLDGEANLEAAILQLGQELDNIAAIDLNKLNEADDFIALVSQIKTGRGLRVLQALDTVHPGSASKILVHAEESSSSDQDPAGFFLKRNIIFERLRLLSRTFSEQRLQLISRALEGEDN
jgi:intracellular multiplication protein IcmW